MSDPLPTGASDAAYDYLAGLSGTDLTRLYAQPSTALAIFRRMLSHLAKTLVMSILYMPDPIPKTDLEAWIRPGRENKKEREKAEFLLDRLHIMVEVRATNDPPRPAGYALSKGFSNSLKIALTGSGDHNSFGVPVEIPENKRVSIDELDEYARQKWEGMLGYMVATTSEVGSAFRGVERDSTVAMLLELGSYVEKKAGGRVVITRQGFELLMQKTNAQVWALLVTYLQNADQTGISPTEALSFFFMLGSLELGRAYSKNNLTESQLTILEDLEALGLTYRSSKTSSRFFPTRLATTITSDAPALRGSNTGSTVLSSTGEVEDTDGYLIIETNYRLYAYTTSPLQIAIIQLFAKLETKYPNMVAGRLTRSSIHKAIDMGITSKQIIGFLETHAHPQMKRAIEKKTIAGWVPPTIKDQIHLWQRENERMTPTPGFLFKDFVDQKEYERMVTYADECGVLVWKSDEKRLFFVTRYEQIAAFYKSIQRRQAGPR